MIDVADEKDAYLSAFSNFERERAGSDSASSWFQSVRREAIDRFAQIGFPTTRQEEWRRTSVAPIARVPFQLAPRPPRARQEADLRRLLERVDLGCCRLVFVNGRLEPGLCSGKLPQGAEGGSLEDALRSRRDLVEPHLAHLAPPEAAFVALNTAFLEDGAFLHIAEGTVLRQPVNIVFASVPGGGPTVSHPRSLVVAGSGAQAKVVETYVGTGERESFTNAVTEIRLGEGAVLEHCKLQIESPGAFHVATVQAEAGRSASFSSRSISLGGALVRSDINAALVAEGAECTLDGLFLAAAGQHVDNHTAINHASPHCTSRELYKGILDAGGSGVFDGRIVVREDARKTDAMQVNRNLLLSDDALIDTKPQLEIYNNDVKCKHAATIGRLDESSLFYLRSRGMDESTARELLIHAFASEVIGRITVDGVRLLAQAAVSEFLLGAARSRRSA